MRLAVALSALLAIAGCGGMPGTHPHDTSAAQHEAMAAGAEHGAALHQAQYDPNAVREKCGIGGGAYGPAQPACWTSSVNPTEQHLEQADQLQKAAAAHRAASQALRDAEARACAGLSDEDRDISPFAHREDIVDVQPIISNVTSSVQSVASPKEQYAKVRGATVTFRAVPGMTAAWLQRVVDCHLARNAALGHVVPEMPFCPLVPNGVTAIVSEAGGGFAVAIQSDDDATAEEVLRRARALVTR